jgi:hypothetical protein
MIASFGLNDLQVHELLRNDSTQRPEERVQSYALRHRQYGRWFNLEKTVALHYFINGFLPKIRVRVVGADVKDRESALAAALRAEKSLFEKQRIAKLETPAPITEKPTPTQEEPTISVICFNCHKPGHIKRFCPARLGRVRGRRWQSRSDRGNQSN